MGEQYQPPGFGEDDFQPAGWQPDGSGGGGADTTPDPFVFDSQTDVALNTLIESAPITITGFDTATTISAPDGLEYSLDGGAYTAVDGTISPAQLVKVRLLSSGLNATPKTGTLVIGNVSGTFTITTLTIIPLVRLRFKLGSLYGSDQHLVRGCYKDPATTLAISIDCYDALVNEWVENEIFAAGEYIRPRSKNGYALKAVVGGLSSGIEPRWPATLDAQMKDGEILWQVVAPGANGLSTLEVVDWSSEPAGIAIAGLGIEESRKIIAEYSGGETGKAYDVVFLFRIDGRDIVARQTVNVLEQ